MDAAWDEVLTELRARPGMYVLAPRFHGVVAYLEGFSRGRADGVMSAFRDWFARRFPADGGHPNPVSYEAVLAEQMFGKRSAHLDADEDHAAILRLCDLLQECLASSD